MHTLHVTPDYLSWDWRPDVLIVLGVAGVLYVTGWRRLRQKGSSLATVGRLTAYLGGLLMIFLALISPIDSLQSVLFTAHMVQHLLLMMFAPPLLWLGNPFPVALWGLPRPVRRWISTLFNQKAGFRRGLAAMTTPFISWMVFEVVLWGWHDPGAYNAALMNDLIHDLEHISFFAAAMLFWWHIVDSPPGIHARRSYLMRAFYALGTMFVNLGPSVAIAMSNRVIYTYYLYVHRDFISMDALTDQRIGGAIMWIPGGMMFAYTALIMIIRASEGEQRTSERSTPQPQPAAT